MKKTVILILVAAVVGVALAFFLAQRGNDNDEPAPPAPAAIEENGDTQPLATDDDATTPSEAADHMVVFDDNGYNPSELTINAGETVEFVNQSSTRNWTASDPHPSHTDLPGFDARNGVEPGQSYQFTFDETGEWGYHDHLNSSIRGVIIVQ